MDELYVFGYGLNKQFPKTLRSGPGQRPEYLHVRNLSTPTCTVRARRIEILWASWCDLILKVDDASYHYYGTSLVQPQIAAIEDLPNDLFKQPVFFGRRDTSGVLGFIIPSQHSITVFHPLEDIHNGKPPVSIHSFASQCWDILDVHFSADAQIPMAFVSLKSHHDDPNSTGTVIEVNWHDFEKDVLGCRDNLFLSHQDEVCMNFGHKQRVKFPPTQLCNNIATLTAVDRSGQVYTYATDRRFSSAMGRDLHPPNEEDEDNQDVAWPVPFLGETVVKKIAAGGLYTAAVSEDGELHIWGQATTDMSGELLAIKNKEETGDEHVRTPDLQIGGQLARVTDVAVGFAYVLIAAEREGRAGIVERAVFAGGNNRHGSTGLGLEMKNMEFVEEFIPVKALQSRKVKQMMCAGMSGFVVVEAEAWRQAG